MTDTLNAFCPACGASPILNAETVINGLRERLAESDGKLAEAEKQIALLSMPMLGAIASGDAPPFGHLTDVDVVGETGDVVEVKAIHPTGPTFGDL